MKRLSFVAVLGFIILSAGAAAAQSVSAERPTSPAIVSPGEISELRGVNAVTITWTAAPEAVSYHIILARDRAFKNVVSEAAHVTGTSWTADGLDYGTYFARISAVSAEGREGPLSETRTFILVPSVSIANTKGK